MARENSSLSSTILRISYSFGISFWSWRLSLVFSIFAYLYPLSGASNNRNLSFSDPEHFCRKGLFSKFYEISPIGVSDEKDEELSDYFYSLINLEYRLFCNFSVLPAYEFSKLCLLLRLLSPISALLLDSLSNLSWSLNCYLSTFYRVFWSMANLLFRLPGYILEYLTISSSCNSNFELLLAAKFFWIIYFKSFCVFWVFSSRVSSTNA